MNENLDIDREAQEYAQNNPEQTPLDLHTFDDMIKYLQGVKNCRVNGKGWHIIDLKTYLQNCVDLIAHVPLENRKTNISCTTTKRQLKKVVEAHYKGHTEKAGTISPRTKFQTYSD